MDLRSNCVQSTPSGETAQVDEPLKTLVGVAGFEPATPASRTHQPAPYPSQYQRLNPTPDDGTNPENDRFRGPACRLRAKDLVTSFAAPTAEGARAGRAVDGHALVFPLPVTASEPLRKVRALAGRSCGR